MKLRVDTFIVEILEVPALVRVVILAVARLEVPALLRVVTLAVARLEVPVLVRVVILAVVRLDEPLETIFVTLAVVTFIVVASTFVVLTELETKILETFAITIGFVKLKELIFAVVKLEVPVETIFVVLIVFETERFDTVPINTFAVVRLVVPVLVRVVETFNVARFEVPALVRVFILAVVRLDVPVLMRVVETFNVERLEVPALVRVFILAVVRLDVPVLVRFVKTFNVERFEVPKLNILPNSPSREMYTFPVTSSSEFVLYGMLDTALNRHWPVPMMCRAGWSFKAVKSATGSVGTPLT